MKTSRECSIGPPEGTAEVALRSWLHRLVGGGTKLLLEERLRFEALLSELSAGVIHGPAVEIHGGPRGRASTGRHVPRRGSLQPRGIRGGPAAGPPHVGAAGSRGAAKHH